MPPLIPRQLCFHFLLTKERCQTGMLITWFPHLILLSMVILIPNSSACCLGVKNLDNSFFNCYDSTLYSKGVKYESSFILPTYILLHHLVGSWHVSAILHSMWEGRKSIVSDVYFHVLPLPHTIHHVTQ